MLERMHAVPGPGGDLAEGIVLGDRRRLIGTSTEEDFRVLGLTHLVAVSGSHLAAACAAVALLGSAIHMPKRALVVVTVAAGAAYAVVTGLPYSALRSLLMLVVGGAGQITGRRGDGVSSLAAAVTGVIAVDPWAVFDLGFQLSALAVGGLLVFGSLASIWITQGVRGPVRAVGSTLALTLVAQLTTVPVVAAGFGMVSLLAPVANAIVGPLVSVAMLVGLSGAVVGGLLPGLAAFASECAASVLGATAWIAGRLALTPGAAIAMNGGPTLALGTAAGAAALWAWWPLPRVPRAGYRMMVFTASASIALALGPAPARQASVTVLDVGQADAILVRDGGRTMLVDTGAEPLALRRALARASIRTIDVMVLTHAHEDHTGGVSGLCGVAEVGWVGIPGGKREDGASAAAAQAPRTRDLMPGDAEWRGPDTSVRELTAGDSWRVGGTNVEVLWPPAEPPGDLHTNDTSVVLLVSRGAFDIVLTGDAEKTAQDGMLAAGTLREVEVLKVPHHGSRNGLTAEALAVWSPRDALISVGTGNDFGHPSPETIELLRASGARILRTDQLGDLVVTVRAVGYRIRTSRRGSRLEVRARMGRIRPVALRATAGTRLLAEGWSRGRKGDRRTQAGLSDLRRRGVTARSRPPPVAGSHRQGRGP
jgi:competence protein ComEC